MIDIATETTMSLREAAQQFHRHYSTLDRWRTHGIRGVRLETFRLGGRRMTSLEALARFCVATTQCVDGVRPRAADIPHHDTKIELALDELGL